MPRDLRDRAAHIQAAATAPAPLDWEKPSPRSGPKPVWRRVEFDEPVNATLRRYPRTLKDAFPVSEGRRSAIEPPEPRFGLIDVICWIVSGGLLLWLAWAALHAPTPLR